MAPQVVVPLDQLVLDERDYPLRITVAADPAPDGRWSVWLEFVDPQTGATRCTAVETTVASPRQVSDWARNLPADYPQQALSRAMAPPPGRDELPPALDLEALTARGIPVLHHALLSLSRLELLRLVEAQDLNPRRLPLALLDQPQLVTFVSTAVQMRRVRISDPLV